jgi:drug/metabolite transporter (DMT)-like permease
VVSSVFLIGMAIMAGWSVVTVLVRAILLGFHFDPWTLAMALQVVAGATLLTAAGLGSLPLEPLKRWATWVIGGFRIVTTCCFSAALLYGSATSITLISTINVPVAALGVLLVFGRRLRVRESPGFLLIMVGIVLLASRLEGGFASPAIPLLLVSETFVVFASLLAERHPDNLGDRRQRLALAGFVTMLSAGGLLTLWSVLGFAFPEVQLGPSSADVVATLTSPWLWLMALMLGAVFRAPLTYMSFQITRLLGADGYMLTMAALPLATLIAELLFSLTGLVPAPSHEPLDLLYSALIIVGSAWIIMLRFRRA